MIKAKALDMPKLLMVDDHPSTTMGYKAILHEAMRKGTLPVFSIDNVHSLKEAYHHLFADQTAVNIVFLDIRMKAYEEQRLFSGEDLGRLVRKHCPNTKLIVMTNIVDNYRINGILSSLNPDGFMIKTEIDAVTLPQAMQQVMEGNLYYGSIVLRLIRCQYLSNIVLSVEEKEFLYLLSTGVHSKDIPEHLPWSSSKVEKQKRYLRDKLGVKNKSVLGLVHKARELGFI